MRHFLLPLLVFVMYCPAVAGNSGSRLYFRTVGKNDGLPSMEIRRIHRDREGFMWLASDAGLVRYDGYEFKLYRSDIHDRYDLPSNEILSVTDSWEYIWAGTEKGLCLIDKKTFYMTSVQDIGRIAIRDILNIGDRMLVATIDGLFSCSYDGMTCTRVDIPGIPEKADVKDLLLDSQGRLWVGIADYGLFRYDFSSETFIRYPSGNCFSFAHILYEDKDGDIWIGSYGGGLVKMLGSEDPRRARYIYYRSGETGTDISSNTIYSIRQDRISGDLWVGHRYGLSILKYPYREKAVFENYRFDGTPGNIPGNDVSDIYQDTYGTMWLATMGGGLSMVDPAPGASGYTSLPEVVAEENTNFVTALYVDTKGLLWLGLKHKGLIIYDPGTGKFRKSNDLPVLDALPDKAMIKSIDTVNDGKEIWIATEDNGVYRIYLENGIPARMAHGIKSVPNNMNKVYQDGEKRIWVVHRRNIMLLDSTANVLTARLLENDLQSFVTSFAEHFNGAMYIGTKDDGIIRLKVTGSAVEYRKYDTDNGGINCNHICSVAVDCKGNVWAGTVGGGLSRYDSTADIFEPVNDRYGIPYADIINIFQDSRNGLWVCSYDAIAKISTGRNTGTELFDLAEYPWTNSCTPGCRIGKLSDSVYVAGGMNGLNFIYPFSMKADKTIPPLAITDIYVNYNSIFSHDVQGCRYDGADLVLDRKNKNFSIHFSALSYEIPHKNRYAFRLSGYDKDWLYVDPDRTVAEYTNIPKGRYVFQVKTAS